MMGGPNMRSHYEHAKVPPPKGIKDVPRYVGELLGGFFKRFAYIVRLVWQSGKWILFLLTFVAVFNGVAPVVGALISRNILNSFQEMLKDGPLPQSEFFTSPIFYLLVFLFVYRILNRTVHNVSNALNRIAGEKVVKQVKLQIMNKSKTVDLASFDIPDFYEKMENANREAGNRPLQIINQTFGVVSTAIEFVSYLTILIAAPGLVWATLVIIAVSIPSAIINFIYRKKTFSYMRFRSKERRQMNYYSDTIVNKDLVKEVRMYDIADTFIGRYLDVFRNYYTGLRRLILSEHAWHIVLGIVSSITNLVFYVIIAMQVFTGNVLIGDYTLYTGAITSVANCIGNLIAMSSTIYEGTLFIDNLISFMKEEQTIIPTVDPPVSVERNAGHTIEFRNVSFRYPGTNKDVIKNVNLTIEPGETVVLVGLNGAGKTTLIKLLTRLYDPTEGAIYLDGRDIREYDVKELYSMFGIIFQDFGKYAVTVGENIRFGDINKDADIDAVREAAIQSSADEYINNLPNGYGTPLMRIFEKNGIELSGGQWQKLAIARAFYADSDVIILDEPTASLDPLAEQEIFNQFDRLRKSKTTIFVSHRLSSATIADKIVVLEYGRVVECGNHADLMELKGKYHELFSVQADRYRFRSASAPASAGD